ncbi:MAG: DUF3094 family protein [Cellvibrionaceae bacterium]
MTDNKQLNEEDLARVESYLNRPNHRIERKPFRPWLLLLIIVLVMTGLSLFSYLLAYLHGVI